MYNLSIYLILNQLHAVSRTQQSRQREPTVRTLRSPLSAEFWRHCVLSSRTQRRFIFNFNLILIEISSKTQLCASACNLRKYSGRQVSQSINISKLISNYIVKALYVLIQSITVYNTIYYVWYYAVFIIRLGCHEHNY